MRFENVAASAGLPVGPAAGLEIPIDVTQWNTGEFQAEHESRGSSWLGLLVVLWGLGFAFHLLWILGSIFRACALVWDAQLLPVDLLEKILRARV